MRPDLSANHQPQPSYRRPRGERSQTEVPLQIPFPTFVVARGSKNGRVKDYFGERGIPVEQRNSREYSESVSLHPKDIALGKARHLREQLMNSGNSKYLVTFGNDVARTILIQDDKGRDTIELQYKPDVGTLEELEALLNSKFCTGSTPFLMEVSGYSAISGTLGEVVEDRGYSLVFEPFTPEGIHFYLYGLQRLDTLSPESAQRVIDLSDKITTNPEYQLNPEQIQELNKGKQIDDLKPVLNGLLLEDPLCLELLQVINGVKKNDPEFPRLLQEVLDTSRGLPLSIGRMQEAYHLQAKPGEVIELSTLRGKTVNGEIEARNIPGTPSRKGTALNRNQDHIGYFILTPQENEINIDSFSSNPYAASVILRHLLTTAQHMALEWGVNKIVVQADKSQHELFAANGFEAVGAEKWTMDSHNVLTRTQRMVHTYSNGSRTQTR